MRRIGLGRYNRSTRFYTAHHLPNSRNLMLYSAFEFEWARHSQNCFFRCGDLHPVEDMVPRAQRRPRPKRPLDRFSHFLHGSQQRVPILYNGPLLSLSKLPIRMADVDSYQTHGSLGPTESKYQTTSRSVQPFLHR